MKKAIDILIVDDNKEFCHLLAEFFEMNKGFNVLEKLYNGKEALNYLETNKNPDFLILDIIMPYLDGIGVLEELNSKNLIGDMKIAVLTALRDDKIMKNVIELGIDYYIMKPFDLDKLLERIKQLMSEENELITALNFKEEKLKLENNYLPYITSIIQDLGIPAHIKGYRYVRYAVKLVINNMNLLNAITKELYPKVAKNFDSSSSRVERAIRHAIDVVWKRGNQKAVARYFKNNLNDNVKPTNSQFIARIADEIIVDLKVS